MISSHPHTNRKITGLLITLQVLLIGSIAHADPAVISIDLLAERTSVWANGHETVQLEATVTDDTGSPVAGLAVNLWDSPNGTASYPPAVVTDADGKAVFPVTSANLGTIQFVANDNLSGAVSSGIDIDFVERRVPVLVQGIRTSVSLGQPVWPEISAFLVLNDFAWATRGEPEWSCDNQIDDDGDGVIDDGCASVLQFSYNGGFVDADGIWRPNPYIPIDTSQNIFTSAAHLLDLLQSYSTANPNTRLVVIGHSQGGLVSLQILRQVVLGQVDLESLITLDGALGGTPGPATALIAAILPDWGPPASNNMIKIWNSASDHNRQGTTAIPVGTRATNAFWVRLARNAGTRVATLGNQNDCIFNPAFCGPESIPDNSSTQIIDNANFSQLLALDVGCSDFSIDCLVGSHSHILGDVTILNFLPAFIGVALLDN